MGKIKVIHICDKFGVRGSTTHGVSKFFAYLMPRHDAEKFDISLVALKQPDTSSRALEAEGIGMEYLGKDKLRASILNSFVQLIRRESPDVVQLHGWIAANFGRLAGRITGVPTIMHEHGVDPKFPMSQQMADRVLSRFTHTAVGVSKSVGEFLVEKRFVKRDKIRLLHHGVPLEEFNLAHPDDVAREKANLGIPAFNPVIGTIGRIDLQKGITHLVKAMPLILHEVPEARFLIVGDGPQKENLEMEARELGVSENVIFTGHRSDIPVIQSMLDVQAFPSLWEGTPLTVFEALAMGRAIVSTSVDGLGEVLDHGRSALVVPPADPGALSNAIIRLLKDSQLASDLASGAREAGKRFDISRTARDLEALYEELCAGSGTRRRSQ